MKTVILNDPEQTFAPFFPDPACVDTVRYRPLDLDVRQYVQGWDEQEGKAQCLLKT
jgi:hypothetical protein